MTVTPYAFLVADRAGDRLAERDPDVLDRMVGVDLQIAFRLDIEIEHRVARDLIEHMIEKRHAGREGRLAAAVEVDRSAICVSVVLRSAFAARVDISLQLQRDSVHEISARRELAQMRQDSAGSPLGWRW